MRKLLKDFRTCRSTKGFTLVELLVAVAITGIVVTVAGLGLVTILQANKRAEAATETRMELNRALDFMAEEVKMAEEIATPTPGSPKDYLDTSVAPNFDSNCTVPNDGVDCVLMLKIPGVAQRVIYYVRNPPENSLWFGPRVIYRWGPNFNKDGTYGNPDYLSRPLIDLVEDSVPDPNPECPSGWLPNPPIPDRDGFYSCVNSSGKVAEIYLRGKLTDSLTKNPSCGSDTKVPYYCIKTRVFARSSQSSP